MVSDQTIGSLTGGDGTSGNITLGTGILSIGNDGSSPAAYGGAITGSGGITKIGTGTLGLSGTSNGYTGATIVTKGTLQAQAENTFSNVSQVVMATTGTATLELNI